ncbi:hypothetical protein [Pseudomonas sp. BBP2017]|nr:hypothetical protein [Pseudomonas sp. BBP2017]
MKSEDAGMFVRRSPTSVFAGTHKKRRIGNASSGIFLPRYQ